MNKNLIEDPTVKQASVAGLILLLLTDIFAIMALFSCVEDKKKGTMQYFLLIFSFFTYHINWTILVGLYTVLENFHVKILTYTNSPYLFLTFLALILVPIPGTFYYFVINKIVK